MEYDVYFSFKISFAFLHVSIIWLLQNNKVDELTNEDTDFSLRNLATLNINSTLKQHDMDTLYGKFLSRNIIRIPFTNSKLNTMKDGYSFNKS